MIYMYGFIWDSVHVFLHGTVTHDELYILSRTPEKKKNRERNHLCWFLRTDPVYEQIVGKRPKLVVASQLRSHTTCLVSCSWNFSCDGSIWPSRIHTVGQPLECPETSSHRWMKGDGNPLACWLSSSRTMSDFCLWYLFLLAAMAFIARGWEKKKKRGQKNNENLSASVCEMQQGGKWRHKRMTTVLTSVGRSNDLIRKQGVRSTTLR